MNTITLILIFEIIPIILWGLGWYFENNSSNYPDMSKGYKTTVAMKSKESWVYSNKVAGKMFSVTGTILFFIIAVGLLLFQIGAVFMAFTIFIIICAVLLIIDGLIRKKFKGSRK